MGWGAAVGKPCIKSHLGTTWFYAPNALNTSVPMGNLNLKVKSTEINNIQVIPSTTGKWQIVNYITLDDFYIVSQLFGLLIYLLVRIMCVSSITGFFSTEVTQSESVPINCTNAAGIKLEIAWKPASGLLHLTGVLERKERNTPQHVSLSGHCHK